MRNISFHLTARQIRNREKTVTRRLGWWNLKPDEVLMACEKCQGLKKSEKVNKIYPIRIISVRKEKLWSVTGKDCIKEGFPDLSPYLFIEMFCEKMKCEPDTLVNRIEFAPVISLADVLLTFEQRRELASERLEVNSKGYIEHVSFDYQEIHWQEVWDFTKDLMQQNEATLNKICKLLNKPIRKYWKG